ncbi:hypothetical protein OC498_01585 [Acinetobacter bohemicus]|uniref:hypothetical protein n=1 Tax=Acinetobacter TaxID=469 RepID=UPI001168A009|nr:MULTISPECIES: hypothetical protein [Acinetobacter]MDM1780285.1 hypothetical protein [Acinetobacter indicus]MCO8041589.1 hypothetical protein [Acinetobacter sp. S4400-12]MCO8046174.1 hypothetical protein [Acinetobacter sp. S4397-1]MCU7223613.1 hypothetical protein [Acinetobacter bohemicus]TQR72101.1 hypothetical protein E2K52_01820 [Acinetobacter sp. RF14B]
MNQVYPLLMCALWAVAGSAYAQDNHRQAQLNDQQPKTWNIGAGLTQKMLHLNTEWVNPYGIAYVKGGVFINDDKTVGAQVGFRYPAHLTGKDKNGYYIGAYAGHIDTKQVDRQDKARLGAGVDLAYVLLNSERISSFSIGIGAGEKLEDRNGRVVAETEPRLQFSYTLSIGL